MSTMTCQIYACLLSEKQMAIFQKKILHYHDISFWIMRVLTAAITIRKRNRVLRQCFNLLEPVGFSNIEFCHAFSFSKCWPCIYKRLMINTYLRLSDVIIIHNLYEAIKKAKLHTLWTVDVDRRKSIIILIKIADFQTYIKKKIAFLLKPSFRTKTIKWLLKYDSIEDYLMSDFLLKEFEIDGYSRYDGIKYWIFSSKWNNGNTKFWEPLVL